MTLSHPEITVAELQQLRQASPFNPTPATIIDMGRALGSQTPYRLVWLRHPDGSQRLYRLVPDPPATSRGHSESIP